MTGLTNYQSNQNKNESSRSERRNTFTLEDHVLKIGELPFSILTGKESFKKDETLPHRQKYNNNKDHHYNRDIGLKQLRKRRTFTQEPDVVSLPAGPYEDAVDDPLGRKRSASVSTMRGKKTINRKKKLKSINIQEKKPSWNNNFQAKGKSYHRRIITE